MPTHKRVLYGNFRYKFGLKQDFFLMRCVVPEYLTLVPPFILTLRPPHVYDKAGFLWICEVCASILWPFIQTRAAADLAWPGDAGSMLVFHPSPTV